MNRLTKTCWIVYILAAFPLAVYCWFAFLMWLTVTLVLGASQNGMTGLGLPAAALPGMIGLWSFGVAYWIALWRGHKLPQAFAWVVFVLPFCWLVPFSTSQLDALPGDGLLPASLQGNGAFFYLLALMIVLSVSLITIGVDLIEKRMPVKG